MVQQKGITLYGHDLCLCIYTSLHVCMHMRVCMGLCWVERVAGLCALSAWRLFVWFSAPSVERCMYFCACVCALKVSCVLCL